MPKKRERLSQQRKEKGADGANATAGVGKPKINVAGTHRVELEKIQRFTSKTPGVVGADCVAVEFKVLETNVPEDVRAGSTYGWVGNLDRTFDGESFPDFDRLDQLMDCIVQSIENGPSKDEAYDAFEDDAEAFAGVEIELETIPKVSKENRPYTLPLFSVVGGSLAETG